MTAPDPNARFWDRLARKYAATPIGDPAGFERTLERARGLLKPSDHVFEFGCGTGTAALKLAPFAAHITATDLSPGMITIAREKAQAEGNTNITFEVGTPDEARWPAAAFDVAVGFNILHLIRDRGAALAGVHRLLKPGGRLMTKTPSLSEANPLIRLAVPVMQAIGKAPYVAYLSEAQLAREIEMSGFEIIARERHGSKKGDIRAVLLARKL